MNALLVLLFALVWVSILAPGALRGRRARSPRSSVDAFDKTMVVLASSRARQLPAGEGSGRATRWPVDRPSSGVPAVEARARRGSLARRKAVLQLLLAAVALTGVCALALGGLFATAFPVAVAGLAGDVLYLVRRRRALERLRATVRPLPALPAPGPEDGAPAVGGLATGRVAAVAAVGDLAVAGDLAVVPVGAVGDLAVAAVSGAAR